VTLLGVDIGTTGCKAAALGEDGSPSVAAYREYPLATPQPGWAELDPDGVWAAVCATIREVTARSPEPPRVLAFATLGEAVTPIDVSGAALAPTMVSFDARALACHEQLVAALGPERLSAITGLAPQPHYSVAKWCWLAAEKPDVYRRAATLACFGDLAAVRLGLPPVIDHTMATRTLAFDAAGQCWSGEILDAAGIDPAKLPAPAPAGTVIGPVARRQVRDLGLADGALLVAGGLDQACAAYGAGIGAAPDGPAMLSVGTVAVLAGVITGPTAGDRPPAIGVPTVPYVVPGTRLAIAGTPAGGAVLRWYRDRFGAPEAAPSGDHAGDPRQHEAAAHATAETVPCVDNTPDPEEDVYERIVASAADVETDLIALPHFAGSRTAFADPQATAALIGLTFASEKRHIVRALLEGVALETAVMAGRLAESGAAVGSLRAVGGGSRSPVWMQIFADVLGVPVESTAGAEAAATGAARLAGAATGDAGRGPDGLGVVARFAPDESRSRRYRSKLARYRGLYRALAELR
jgi:xylulokinase